MAASTISNATKAPGDNFTSAEANDIKTVVNQHAPLIDTNTSVSAAAAAAILVLQQITGWATYEDGTYTSGSPLGVLASTPTMLPNDGATSSIGQAPAGVTFYSSGEIIGRLNDSIDINVQFKIKPNSATQNIDIWLDAGGASTELFRQSISMVKGAATEHDVLFVVSGATMGADWAANEAVLKIETDDTADVYDIKYTFGRTHQAR